MTYTPTGVGTEVQVPAPAGFTGPDGRLSGMKAGGSPDAVDGAPRQQVKPATQYFIEEMFEQ